MHSLALAGQTLGATRSLITALHDPTVATSIVDLGGYDLQHTSVVEALDE